MPMPGSPHGAGESVTERNRDPAWFDPWSVRFSRRSVLRTVRERRSPVGLADGHRTGRIAPTSIPPIRRFRRGDPRFSLDNRRLWAIRRVR